MDLLDRLQKYSKLYDDEPVRINRADGGRIGFYKGKLVEGKGWVVKYPGLSAKGKDSAVPDEYFGTKIYKTEEEMNRAIAERKKFTEQNISKKPNIEKIQKEKNFKKIVDDIFENEDFKSFKASVTKSQKRAAARKGKVRTDTGGKVPQQYLAEFNKAMAAGPDSPEFKRMMDITGRTQEELLELNTKRPAGKVDPKLRIQRATEYGGVEKKPIEELKKTQQRYQRRRGENIAFGKKFASAQDLLDYEKIEEGKQNINKYFQKNPDAINNTEFGKNIKEMMAIRVDQKGNMYSRVMPDEYYLNKAKEGSLFDIFDITPVSKKTRNIRYPVNINITPGDFNSAFIQGQAVKLFEKGVNKDTLDKFDDYLKQKNIRVELPKVGRIGAAPGVGVERTTGDFPTILKTLKTMKAPPEILKNFENVASRIAAIGCGGKAKGGRIGFETGGSVACIKKGFEKIKTGKGLSPGDKANIRALTKNPGSIGKAARVFTKLGLGSELVAGGLFALTDYATGANKDEIISNLTFGLGGKSQEEQLKAQDPLYGKADELMGKYAAYERAKQVGPRRGGRPPSIQEIYKFSRPFLRPSPQLEEGEFFDFDILTKQALKDEIARERFQKQKEQRALERGFYKPGSAEEISPFQAAGGGIAKLAGVDEGPAPKSGPNPQGLLSLKKSVNNY